MTREEAARQIYGLILSAEDEDGPCIFSDQIEALEMAIEVLKEEPRTKAKWLPYEYGSENWHKCSNCGKPTQYQHFYKAFDGKEHLMRTEIQNYCRYCGAEMENAEAEQ